MKLSFYMIIQQQQLLQKMNSADQTSLDVFPHFISEWQLYGSYYKHKYSSDMCELRKLKRVPAKELDLYTSREIYSFPFCPKVYKYSIQRNQLIDNQIAFDIKLLLQHVPNRLSSKTSNEQTNSKTIDILRALEYLRLRFGPFHIKKGMIGWTTLGVFKVWINQDFSANFVQEEAASEEEMVQDILRILSECDNINLLKSEKLSSIASMIEFMEESHMEKNQLNIKKKALKQIQNFSNSDYSIDRHHKDLNQINSTQSRKNITFSYSNKNIDNKPLTRVHQASKRSSIALIDDDYRRRGNDNSLNLLQQTKGLAFTNNHQSSSLKIIQQKKTNQQKKMSMFRPLEHNTSNDGLKIKKLSDYFSGTTSNNSENQIPKISEIYRHSVQEKPGFLYFSTSSNPFNKLSAKFDTKFNQRDFQENEEHQKDEKSSVISNGSSKQRQQGIINELDRELTEFTIAEKKQTCQQAQKILKDDLDALFNSDHQFDYGELENELDHVLL